MQAIYQKHIVDRKLKIHHLDKIMPQTPDESPDFWEIWKRELTNLLNEKIDFVFSSEDYGERLAAELNAVSVCIDLKREKFNISGSQIRENPFTHWEMLPVEVRHWFVKKIVITGPESTGKSTLTKLLADAFKTNFIPEYAREYLDKKGRYVRPADILPIAEGHVRSEDIAIKNSNKILFCDTDLIVTEIYAWHYFNSVPEEILKNNKNRHYDHWLLLNIDTPWVADWQRDLGDQRDKFFRIFEQKLKEYNKPYTLIEGNWNERLLNAVKTIGHITGIEL